MGKHTFDPNHLRWENPFNLGHSFCWQPTYRMWKQDTRSLCLRALVLTGKVTVAAMVVTLTMLCLEGEISLPFSLPFSSCILSVPFSAMLPEPQRE